MPKLKKTIKYVIETKIVNISIDTNNHCHKIVINTIGDSYLAHEAVLVASKYIESLFNTALLETNQ
jgi:hypothetical protein